VAAEPPDLVLLDVMMPRMDGFTCLKHLRAFSTVPVVVLTAKGEEHDKVHGLDLGADDFFTKPFDPAELLARVRAVLHCRQEPIGATPAVVTIGDITIDLARQSSTGGAKSSLPPPSAGSCTSWLADVVVCFRTATCSRGSGCRLRRPTGLSIKLYSLPPDQDRTGPSETAVSPDMPGVGYTLAAD